MKQLIDNLLNESMELGVELGKASSLVRYIENEFSKKMKFNIPFEFAIINSEHNGYKISWERHKESKKKIFRLYLKSPEGVNKILQELNLETKLEFNKYIAQFLEAFCKYIKDKKIEAQNAIPEISNDELEWIKSKNDQAEEEKIINKTASLSNVSVLHSKDQEAVEVVCTFCGEAYIHTKKDIPDYCSKACYKMDKMKNSYL